MTSFTKSQIPNDIATVEQLAAWALECLSFINPEASVIINASQADLVVQTGVQRFAQNANSPSRFVGGCYLPRANDAGTKSIWAGIAEITPGQLPNQFKQAGT